MALLILLILLLYVLGFVELLCVVEDDWPEHECWKIYIALCFWPIVIAFCCLAMSIDFVRREYLPSGLKRRRK